MGEGIFAKLLGSLESAGENIPDQRQSGHNLKYRLLDGIKSAFAVFFFQHPSLLDFQRAMKERKKRNNVETLFGVTEIPSDNQIRTLLDGIAPQSLGEVFGRTLRTADEAGAIQPYRVLEGGILLAPDGLWY
jgi:hypothetical protein